MGAGQALVPWGAGLAEAMPKPAGVLLKQAGATARVAEGTQAPGTLISCCQECTEPFMESSLEHCLLVQSIVRVTSQWGRGYTQDSRGYSSSGSTVALARWDFADVHAFAQDEPAAEV